MGRIHVESLCEEEKSLPVNTEQAEPVEAAVPSPMSPEEEELINRVVYFQDEYEHPKEEDVAKVMKEASANESPSVTRVTQMLEMTLLNVRLIVEFAKRIPAFDKLVYKDKIMSLNISSSELIIMRAARKYDFRTDSIIFADNRPYPVLACFDDSIIEDLLRFGRLMYDMRVNNIEYALLSCIVIFSVRPNLLEARKFEKIQKVYSDTLKAYVRSRHADSVASTRYEKFMMVLDELRTMAQRNR